MKYNDLYSSIEDNEEELYLSLSSVISDDQVIRDAIKNYKLGKAQDLVYAENLIAKGSSFAMVDKVLGTNIKRRASSRPVFDTKLRKALIKSKGLPDKVYAYEAHHIVAKGDVRARRAVEILFALGIDIDDPDNGVFLPKDEKSKKRGVLKTAFIHGNIHTIPYYANVNFQIIEAYANGASKEDVKNLLRDIADDLRRGRYPVFHYIPGAEISR